MGEGGEGEQKREKKERKRKEKKKGQNIHNQIHDIYIKWEGEKNANKQTNKKTD